MTFERGYQIFVRTSYIVGIAIIIIFLPFSKYILSIGMWTVTGAWILERVNMQKFIGFYTTGSLFRRIILALPYTLMLWFGSMGRGFKVFFRNRPAMILASLYLLHLLGLFVTSDFGYALKDLRTKAPMLILPIYFSTSRAFGSKDFYRFLLLFVINLVIVTLANTWKLVNFEFIDIRDISVHISHIILGLMVSMALFIAGYFMVRKKRVSFWIKAGALLVITWFIIYLLISRSFTGLGVLIITLLILLVIYTFRSKNIWLKAGCILSIILVVGGGGLYINSIVRDYYRVEEIDFTKLDSISPSGHRYTHHLENRQTENGHYIWIYIQWEELREGWNHRSAIPFDSTDLKGQEVKYTLIRYLTSKGCRKDAGGIAQLTGKDVEAIERGIADVVNLNWLSLRGRMFELLMGYERYQTTGDPTGSSLMQRLEFWKASLGIVRNNWLVGVGTGDMNIAFRDQYEEMHTKLAEDQWWRSHNQFLSILIGFGIFGLIWFLFSLIYPALLKRGFQDYFFLTFFIIAMLSMITEDTLESQAGVSFFYFFYAFFLFGRRDQDPL
ncbi:MAG: O-antigen ligase domain-containing protein [Bacteroidetes bacterium]|nr:MAG: O-antigen ligase domain-containing protein [Bacteroidota bacterium]